MPAAAEKTAKAVVTLPGMEFSPTQVWRDLQAWVDAHGTQIILALVAGLAIYLLLSLTRSLAARLKDRPGDYLGFRALLGRAASRT
ncbi:hypothetical protein L6232_22950, partial [Shewanella sp. C31]|nr:hypothetical protein [Shewanella electrica]